MVVSSTPAAVASSDRADAVTSPSARTSRPSVPSGSAAATRSVRGDDARRADDSRAPRRSMYGV